MQFFSFFLFMVIHFVLLYLNRVYVKNVFLVSHQQGLTCLHCHDCTRGSPWIERDCNDDSPIGDPTTPGPINPWRGEINDSVASYVESTRTNWHCYTMVYEIGGRQSTQRGCIQRHTSDQETCRSINSAQIWCELCSGNNCNNSARMLISILMTLAALLIAIKL